MNKRPLILVGGGGHCLSVMDVAESAGYTILGVLDKPELVGQEILHYKYIGTDADMGRYADEADFLITVGQIKSNAIRARLAEQIKLAGGRLAIVVAADAHVSEYASLGEGTVVMHKALVNAGAEVDKNCIINTGAIIEHNARIGQLCHISTGAIVNGDSTVGENCFVGSRAVVSSQIGICDNCIIGAGTVVVKDIKDAGTYIGSPAHRK